MPKDKYSEKMHQLLKDNKELSLRQISKELSISRAQIYVTLASLERRGILVCECNKVFSLLESHKNESV